MKNNLQPLRHGKIIKDLGLKYLVSFTYSATIFVEDEVTINLPIRKSNVIVNAYGIVCVPIDVHDKIMKYLETGKF